MKWSAGCVGLRAAAVVGLVALTACASQSPQWPHPIVGIDIRPAAPCSDDAVVPQLVDTQPAVLPASVWDADSPTAFESRVRFRVGENGDPTAIHVALDPRPDGDAVMQAVTAALAGHRFCKPVAYGSGTEWFARILFRPGHARQVSSGRYYVQLFVPAYTRDDVHAGRNGTTRVRALFDGDGRPVMLRVLASSGDPVLDRKSLESMASERLVIRAGAVFTPPFALEQPYQYAIR